VAKGGPHIEVEGDRAAQVHLLQLGLRAKDVRPVEREVEQIFHRSEKRMFSSDGRGQWPPLSDATLANKAARGDDQRILRATGELFTSLTEGRLRRSSRDKIVLGTDVKHARFAGGTKHQPARRLIDLTLTERRDMERAIQKHITGRKR
jgi:phage gpG-like protein